MNGKILSLSYVTDLRFKPNVYVYLLHAIKKLQAGDFWDKLVLIYAQEFGIFVIMYTLVGSERLVRGFIRPNPNWFPNSQSPCYRLFSPPIRTLTSALSY